MSNKRRRLEGRVVSDKMDKTVVVEVERLKRHRIYEKVLITTKRVMAHDEANNIPMGAVVRIVESRPISKNKRWVVEEVLVDPGNKVVESISDESEVQEYESVGVAQGDPDGDAETTPTDAAAEAAAEDTQESEE
jgi:small subunit ribosomal protein S17